MAVRADLARGHPLDFSGCRLLGAGDAGHCLEHGSGLQITVKKLPDPGDLCSRETALVQQAPPHGRSAGRGWWAWRDGTKAERSVAGDAAQLHAIGIDGINVRVRRPFGTTQDRGQVGDQAAAAGARVTVLRRRNPMPCVQPSGVVFADSPAEGFLNVGSVLSAETTGYHPQ